jgi:hypothetical protein
MPKPKPRKGSSRTPRRDFMDGLDQRSPTRKRRKPRGGSAELEPVEPNKPNLLSGGAAAELEFDE